MRSGALFRGCKAALMSVAVLAVGCACGTAAASACDDPCEYGYGYGPGNHGGYGPAAVYAAPPVYAYSYYGAAYPYGPPSYGSYYRSRVNVFAGPRWTYSAAYNDSPGAWRGPCGFRYHRARVRPCYAPRHRAYVQGPIIRTWRHW